MQDTLTLLQELDRLYHADCLEAYERHWQMTARLVKKVLPGFTIAYAELYNSGISRLSDATLSHVLVPICQQWQALDKVMVNAENQTREAKLKHCWENQSSYDPEINASRRSLATLSPGFSVFLCFCLCKKL